MPTLRHALQALVHELYFKSSHFPGLKGYSPRELHDADLARYQAASQEDLLGEHDPFTALLTARASRLPTGTDATRTAAIVDVWERAESTLNARMRTVFGFLGPNIPPSLVSMLVGDRVVPAMEVSAGRNPIGGKRSDKLFGQPDLVLLGADTAISIEMKVRGGTARACYDVLQHYKYLRLAEALRNSLGVAHTYHVLLAPLDARGIVAKADQWLAHPVTHGASLTLDLNRFEELLPPRQRGEVQAAGGGVFLTTLSAGMPSRCVDLGLFLDEVDRVAGQAGQWAPPLRRQVAALREFGLGPPPSVSDPSLGRIKVKRKSGSEAFHHSGTPTPTTALDFWRWSTSDLVSNTTRGILAEYIVAKALDVDTSGVREEWAAFDLTTPDGVKVEVKSAAYLQSWQQSQPSVISFRTKKTRGWSAETNRMSEEIRRQADVYVFALLVHPDKATVDPLDLDQWRFWVVPTAVLDARERSQHSITLRSLEALAGPPVEFSRLREAFEATRPGRRSL